MADTLSQALLEASLLSSIPEEDEGSVIIDVDRRTMVLPTGFFFGVYNDKDILKVPFVIPRYYNELDLSEFQITVNYINSAGYGNIYRVTDAEVTDSAIRFKWVTGRGVFVKEGTVRFIVCLRQIGSNGEVEKEFNTTIASANVLKGLEVDENPDPVAYSILAHMEELKDQAEAAVEVVEGAAGRIDNAVTEAEQAIAAMYHSPYIAPTAADMLSHDKVYVYTGNETGYTFGNWYYWNGSAFVSGGVYNATAFETDATLTQSGKAADAGAVGYQLNKKPEVGESTEEDVDLDVCDDNGNVLVRFSDGHVKTKSFDSQDIKDEVEELQEDLVSLENDLSDEINSVKEDLSNTPKVLEPEETEADLYICDQQGNVIGEFVGGHIKTKNFDSSNVGTDTIMDADSSDADLYICDSFGHVIAEFANGHIKTKNFDSVDMDGIPEDVEALQADVAALQSASSGILYRNKDATDGVYAACRYHQPNSTSKQFCLLIAGDIHADGIRMQNMVKYLNAIDAFDAGIMLGDMSGNSYSDTIAFYLDALENVQKPFLTVLGNHDVAGAASDAELYTKFGDCFQYAQLASGETVSGKCYYYKDFSAQKIRVIVLMQYDIAGRASDTGDLCFGQDQINWFIGVLNSTPSDYGIIIAEHTNPSRYMTYNMDEKYTSSTWHQTNYAPTVMEGNPIPDIVNAWINGITISQTYNYTFSDPPAALSVSADFTDRGTGEFITYLGGHWHMDVLGTPTGYTNQPDYHIPAAGLSSATQGDIPRKTGTRSEDSLGVIAVDRDKKTVKVFHIGAHFTKDAVDRLYFKYSYGA